MPLTEREQVVVAVANALTAYSMQRSDNRIPPSTTPHQFVLDNVPARVRSRVTASMIDEVFAALASAHGS